MFTQFVFSWNSSWLPDSYAWSVQHVLKISQWQLLKDVMRTIHWEDVCMTTNIVFLTSHLSLDQYTCILFIHGGLPVLPGWLVSCTGLSQCLEISLSLGQLPWRVRFREVGCRCREPLVKFGCFFASWDAFPVPRCQRVFQELTEGTERWGLVLGVDGVCHFPACLPLGSAQVTLS